MIYKMPFYIDLSCRTFQKIIIKWKILCQAISHYWHGEWFTVLFTVFPLKCFKDCLKLHCTQTMEKNCMLFSAYHLTGFYPLSRLDLCLNLMRTFYNKSMGFSNSNWHELRSILRKWNFMMKKKYGSYPLMFTTNCKEWLKYTLWFN